MTEALANAVLSISRSPVSAAEVGIVVRAKMPTGRDELVPAWCSLEVSINGETYPCDWTGPFQQEAISLGGQIVGQAVLVVRVGGQFCAVGTYISGSK